MVTALDSRLAWRRQEVVARDGMITCLHPLAAEAAVATLRAGGNAIDAAVVAGFVLGVVEPMMSGIGGGGVLVARLAGGDTVVIDHGSQAPAAAATWNGTSTTPGGSWICSRPIGSGSTAGRWRRRWPGASSG